MYESESGGDKPISERLSQIRIAVSNNGRISLELGPQNPLSESTMTKLANPNPNSEQSKITIFTETQGWEGFSLARPYV
jgi:hypothetical protein